MATLRISLADLERDLHDVLGKVRQGDSVVIEEDDRPIAIIKPTNGPGRPISECIARAKAHEDKLGSRPTPDADFARDVQEGIDARSEPLRTPDWD